MPQFRPFRPRIARWSIAVAFALLAALALSTYSTPARAEVAPPGAVPGAVSIGQQTPPAPPSENLRFDRISLEQGLSQSAALSIWQDRQGFMWFGTEGGLNRFDGYQFTVYRHDGENNASLGDDYVSSIFQDRDGRLWLGTRSGLDLFHPDTGIFEHFRHDDAKTDSLSGTWVTVVTQDRDGALWVGTDDGGLNRMIPGTTSFVRYPHDPAGPKSLADPGVRAIYSDSRGQLWVGTSSGLDRFDAGAQVFIHYTSDPGNPASLSANDVSAISEDKRGNLWVGTESGGLNRMDRTAGTFVRYKANPDDPNSLIHNRVRAVIEDHAGRLWVGTQNGLDRWDDQRQGFAHYRNDPSDPYSLSSDTIWSIYEDRAGVLWFGTYSGGVNKFSDLNNRFAVYRHNPYLNSLTDNVIWAIAQDRNGMLWIGTFNGGLNRLNRESGVYTAYRHKPADPGSLSSDDVRAIVETRDGALWVGTSGGLDRFQPATGDFAHYLHDPNSTASLSDNRVTVMLESRDGHLWVGTRNGGLNRLDVKSGAFVRYQHDPKDPTSLSDNRVWALYEDRSGAIWVATLDGINVLDPATGEFKHYTNNQENPKSLSSNSAFAFYEDPSGAMWIGTWGSGLDRLDRTTGSFTHLTMNDGLPDNVIYAIEPDEQGRLWMSTNRGLSRLDPATLQFRNYDIRDGLQSNEFNAGAHARGPDGELFFGGVNGLNSFFPRQIRDNPNVPPVVITDYSKFNRSTGRALAPGARLELEFNDNFLSFDYATLDYTAPYKNQYQYKMDGLDKDWVYAGDRRHADYPNLPPGEYVFRVRGSNNDGLWNTEGAAVIISITPPFWETWWFRGGLGLVLAALAIGGYRWRVRSMERRSRELERDVASRTAEIARQTRELEALYRADEELYSQLDLDSVLQALVDVAVDQLHVDKSVIFLWDESRKALALKTARGVRTTETLKQISVPRGAGTIGKAAETGEPIVVEDLAADPHRSQEQPEILRLMEEEDIRAFINMPLRAREQLFGVLGMAFERPHHFGAEEQRLYLALAQRAALAIENAQLYERSQQSAALEERSRLARELHDAVTQTLFSANLIADVLPRLWEKNPDVGRERLQELKQLSRGALAEMRTLLLELRPASLADSQFPDLLRQLATAFTGRTGLRVRVDIVEPCQPPANIKVGLYRITQEALNNIAKHAQATEASICVQRLAGNEKSGAPEERFELSITDNGTGFDPAAVSGGHLGLGIIQERARSVGARAIIESSPGKGTAVRVIWDMAPAAVTPLVAGKE